MGGAVGRQSRLPSGRMWRVEAEAGAPSPPPSLPTLRPHGSHASEARRQIANPDYKGKWFAPKIDNPSYIGVWKPKQIPNPK